MRSAPRPARQPTIWEQLPIPVLMPLEERETMMKATVSSRRIGQLVNHHHANIAVTTGNIALHHTMLRRGHNTMSTTMPGRMLTPRQDNLPCKPS